MPFILLIVIYLSFISLGLPDSLLGAAWPAMQSDLGTPVYAAGCISLIISCGTVISSLLADGLLRRFSCGIVSGCSVLLTAVGMYGFSAAESLRMLCLSAIPCGLGAGAVDAALNHYVAVHYPARHLLWLHCFWGIGCALSPVLMGAALQSGSGWQGGCRAVAMIQIVLTGMLFCALPLWRKTAVESEAQPHIPMRILLRMSGVPQTLLTVLCYAALESTAILWASSFCVQVRGMHPKTAAQAASLLFLGITAGRLLCGFLTRRFGTQCLIRAGLCGIACGLLLLILPLPAPAACAGLIILGTGCAPVSPCITHDTPVRFGKAYAQELIGMQTSAAYIGTSLMPPLFGLLTQCAGMEVLPLFLAMFLAMTALLTDPAVRAESCPIPSPDNQL